jgi:hypothetical protein
MTKLLDLPPELRNIIYDLLVFQERPVAIATPRRKNAVKKTQQESHFAAILSVNKQTNKEAKTIFFSQNTFLIGNGWWGSTMRANVQALKEFIKRVPKECIALIREIELDIYFKRIDVGSGLFYHIHSEELKQLEIICRALTKHFIGLEEVSAAAVQLIARLYRPPRIVFRNNPFYGNVELVAKSIKRLLALPSLKKIHFITCGAEGMEALVSAVMKGHESDFEQPNGSVIKRKDSPSPMVIG